MFIVRHISPNTFWTNYKRAKQLGALFEKFTKCVIDWWTIKTNVFLNQKDVVKLKT